MRDDAPSLAAIESALIVYSFARHHLGFLGAHFQVNRSNERVWRFHERFGAQRISEDDVQYHYKIDSQAIDLSMQKYQRYLPEGIVVKEMLT